MIKFIATKTSKLSKLVIYYAEDLSYSAFMKLLRKKDVKVNGKRVGNDIVVEQGDKIELYYNNHNAKYSIIYQDDNVVAINKKSGYTSESVYDALTQEFAGAKFIHRLDRNTSGVMIFALNANAEKELLLGFKNRTFGKKYLATVTGKPKVAEQVLTAYLVKDAKNAKVKIYSQKVSNSVLIKTGYKLISYDKNSDSSLLEIELFTGKTHQIRAHMAFLGHPIVGDGKYGTNTVNKKLNVRAQQLTAYKLTLNFNESSFLYYLNGTTFCVKEND